MLYRPIMCSLSNMTYMNHGKQVFAVQYHRKRKHSGYFSIIPRSTSANDYPVSYLCSWLVISNLINPNHLDVNCTSLLSISIDQNLWSLVGKLERILLFFISHGVSLGLMTSYIYSLYTHSARNQRVFYLGELSYTSHYHSNCQHKSSCKDTASSHSAIQLRITGLMDIAIGTIAFSTMTKAIQYHSEAE